MILSVFPGIDILGLGFEATGFTVVRGPDPMWGRAHDIRNFHVPPGVFSGVIGGPPCQAHSRLAHVVRARYGEGAVADDLVPEFARIIGEAAPIWFLMENVPAAPRPETPGYAVNSFLLNNRWLDGGGGVGETQNRLRRFWFGVREGLNAPQLQTYVKEWAVLENADWKPAVLASGGYKYGKGQTSLREKRGESRALVRESLRLQGLPEDFFEKSPFTVKGQQRLIGNAVPLPMAKILARAIARWLHDQGENITHGEMIRCASCGKFSAIPEMAEENGNWVCMEEHA